jgi:hypothetical protein
MSQRRLLRVVGFTGRTKHEMLRVGVLTPGSGAASAAGAATARVARSASARMRR